MKFCPHLPRKGKIPEDWRAANITPIYNKERKKEAGNYRPAALMSVCCKLLEHLVRDEITEHLESNRLLRESQHRFRANKSYATIFSNFWRR